MCAPYFVNLNNNTFQLKRYYSLFIYAFTAKENRQSHLQLSHLQCFHFDIVILRVAIISNVPNVRLQRRDRPTDDVSTRRWRGSQQASNDTFIYYIISNTFFKGTLRRRLSHMFFVLV